MRHRPVQPLAICRPRRDGRVCEVGVPLMNRNRWESPPAPSSAARHELREVRCAKLRGKFGTILLGLRKRDRIYSDTSTALSYGASKQSSCLGRDYQVIDSDGARGLAGDSYALWIGAKSSGIVVNPLQRRDHILQSIVSG